MEMCTAGADLLAGHSAHVFHGIGFEEGHPVIYDLGGALDDYMVHPDLRNDLGLLAIWRVDERPGDLDVVGLVLDYCRTRLASGEEADFVAARLQRACGELGSEIERLESNLFRVRSGMPAPGTVPLAPRDDY